MLLSELWAKLPLCLLLRTQPSHIRERIVKALSFLIFVSAKCSYGVWRVPLLHPLFSDIPSPSCVQCQDDSISLMHKLGPIPIHSVRPLILTEKNPLINTYPIIHRETPIEQLLLKSRWLKYQLDSMSSNALTDSK